MSKVKVIDTPERVVWEDHDKDGKLISRDETLVRPAPKPGTSTAIFENAIANWENLKAADKDDLLKMLVRRA